MNDLNGTYSTACILIPLHMHIQVKFIFFAAPNEKDKRHPKI